jgi:hypothetical protein
VRDQSIQFRGILKRVLAEDRAWGGLRTDGRPVHDFEEISFLERTGRAGGAFPGLILFFAGSNI